MNKFVPKLRHAAVAAASMVSASSAFALDMTEITSVVSTSKADIAVIGAAVIGIVVAVRSIGWISRAIKAG